MISWRRFDQPKPSVGGTKARPRPGPLQNAAIHREGEPGEVAKLLTVLGANRAQAEPDWPEEIRAHQSSWTGPCVNGSDRKQVCPHRRGDGRTRSAHRSGWKEQNRSGLSDVLVLLHLSTCVRSSGVASAPGPFVSSQSRKSAPRTRKAFHATRGPAATRRDDDLISLFTSELRQKNTKPKEASVFLPPFWERTVCPSSIHLQTESERWAEPRRRDL